MLRKGDILLSEASPDRLLVLWIGSGTIAVLDLASPTSTPELRLLEEAEAACASRKLRLDAEPRDLSDRTALPISDRDRKIRDENMAILEPLLCQEPDIYDPIKRGRLIGALTRTGVASRNHVKQLLDRYLRGGQCSNALLPRYHHCGSKNRRPAAAEGGAKLGRPVGEDGERHANVTLAIQAQFLEATRRERNASGETFTIKGAYNRYKRENCLVFVQHDGEPVAEYKPEFADEYPPSYAQFLRWYNGFHQPEATARAQMGDAIYDKDNRALVGTSTAETWGPGSRYQIDATTANHSLCSRLDRRLLLGRPIIYFVSDVLTRLIAGYSIGFINASWVGAALALANAFSPKEPVLRRLGIDPSKNPWPAKHVPAALTHDGGELRSHRGDLLVGELNIDFENSAVDRADMKGVVERKFGWTDAEYGRYLPGRRASANYKGRGVDERRAEQGNLLNPFEFELEVVLTILRFNNSNVLTKFDPDQEMIAARVPFIPLNLWKWGIVNRGLPRTYAQDKLRFALMPQREASVAREGILHEGEYYSCPALWPLQKLAGIRRPKVVISYDFGLGDTVYWHSPTAPNGYFECPLAPASRSKQGLWSQEIIEHNHLTNTINRTKVHEAELRAAADAHAQEERLRVIAEEPVAGPKHSRSQTKMQVPVNRAAERQTELGEKVAALGTDPSSKPGSNIYPFPKPAGLSIEEIEDADD
jgi:hypothetical protein